MKRATLVAAAWCVAWAMFGVVTVEEAMAAENYRVYIGTYTRGASEGIYLLAFDAATGTLTSRGLAGAVENPSFLALDEARGVLYAVGEMSNTGEDGGGTISAFRIDKETGMLTLINHESTRGDGPCHVALAPGGKHVAVANYGGGSVALLPVAADGTLGEASAFVQHEGSSVNAQRQQGPHAHSVTFDKAGKHVLAADLGLDKVIVYRYDAATGGLEAAGFGALAPGAGPRHVTFDSTGKFVYVVNEMANTVTVFAYDAATGGMTELQTIGTLPEGFAETSHTAEIRMHPSGKYVYASNRGHDSLAAFAVDAATGKLTALGQTSTEGKTPRNFNVDPTGKWVLAANQNSDSLVVLRVKEDGGLVGTGVRVDVPTPVCVVFQPLAAD